MNGVLIRGEDTETQEGCHVMMEAEIGVMLLKNKKYLGLPEAARSKEGSAEEPLEGLLTP